MAFEPNFEKIVASVRKRLGVVQSQVECKLPMSDEVKKILCNNAKANIVDVEVSGREIVYSGFVNFQVMYVNQNQEYVSVDYCAEFKEKFQSDMEMENKVPIANISVIDVNCIVNNEVKVVALVEITMDVIENNSTSVLTNVAGDNYYVKKDILNYTNYETLVSNKFEINNDVEIKDGVSKILSVCPSVFIEKTDIQERYLILNGGIYFDICYLTDNNVIRTTQASFDFSQEIANDYLNENSLLQNDLQILYNDMKVTTNIDTDSAIVNIEVPLLYKGYVFKNNDIEVVSDLYGTNHFTNIVVESIKSMCEFENILSNEKLNGSITIQENDAFIDEVLGNCCSSVVVANSVVEDNKLSVEGVATITVLYLNKETNSVYSVEVEMPFRTSINIDLKDGVNTPVKLTLTNIQSRARRGKEIEVSANLEVYSDVYFECENAVITNAVEEDEIPENECAMSFYFVKDGDALWEIAKELRTSVDMLLAQNPGLDTNLKAGSKVVVYRQRQVQF